MYFGLSDVDFYNILIKLKTGDNAPPISTSIFSSPPTEKGSDEKQDHAVWHFDNSIECDGVDGPSNLPDSGATAKSPLLYSQISLSLFERTSSSLAYL